MSAELIKAIQKAAHKEKLQRFNGLVEGSRATVAQQGVINAVLNRTHLVVDVRAGNRAGKSLTACKILATMLREDPDGSWQRPAHWKGPLLLILLARQTRQAEESLLPKLVAHLEPDSYQVHRVGGLLNKLVMKKTGSVLLFFSHHNVREAQQAVQSFDAHGVFIDELPKDPMLIEECILRVNVQKGVVCLTYTPKQPAPKVKKFLENLPDSQRIRLPLTPLDNPAIDEVSRQTMLATAASQGKAHLATVMEGAWATGENNVYNYNDDTCHVELPASYSPQTWRHVASVDPGSASATGIVVAANQPGTPRWLVVHASYVEGVRDPAELVRQVEARLAPYRIVRRIYDSSAAWYEGAARAAGFSYMPVMNKANRKLDMIAATNTALGTRVLLTDGAQPLAEELSTASWSETAAEKISHAHEYHTADALNYLIDLLPPPDLSSQEETQAGPVDHLQRVWQAHHAPKKSQQQGKTVPMRRSRAWLTR